MSVDTAIRQNNWGKVYDLLLDKDPSMVEDKKFVCERLGNRKCLNCIDLFLSIPGFDTRENRANICMGGAQSGHKRVVEDMLSHIMKEGGNTTLTINNVGYMAGWYGRKNIIDYLLETYGDSVDVVIIAGGAAKGGYIDIVVDMVESRGRHIPDDALNFIGYNAAEGGHMDIVDYVIERGASDPSYIAQGAALGGFMSIVDDLVNTSDYIDVDAVAISAAEGGHKDIVDYMIDLGADNYSDIGMAASNNGHDDIAKEMSKRDE
jgi:hypothetical protein